MKGEVKRREEEGKKQRMNQRIKEKNRCDKVKVPEKSQSLRLYVCMYVLILSGRNWNGIEHHTTPHHINPP